MIKLAIDPQQRAAHHRRVQRERQGAAEIQVIAARSAAQIIYPLRDALKTAVERGRRPARRQFSITIRAEKDLEYSMLQQVLIECANAGVKNLNYGSVGRRTEPAPPPNSSPRRMSGVKR